MLEKNDKVVRSAKFLLSKLEDIDSHAKRYQTCLRKSVGCCSVQLRSRYNAMACMRHNGPSVQGNVCTNVVGNCGCSHSEPRVVSGTQNFNYINQEDYKWILVCTYSPCTNCANIVIDSGLFIGVVYDILTEHDKRGAEFLEAAGIKCITKRDIERFIDRDGDSNMLGTMYDTIKGWIVPD